jgi:hypothetical protein
MQKASEVAFGVWRQRRRAQVAQFSSALRLEKLELVSGSGR